MYKEDERYLYKFEINYSRVCVVISIAHIQQEVVYIGLPAYLAYYIYAFWFFCTFDNQHFVCVDDKYCYKFHYSSTRASFSQ